MKNTFLKVLLLISCINFSLSVEAKAQENPNTIYLEFLGNGLFGSLHYERQLLNNIPLNLHLGAGVYGRFNTYLTIPMGVNYLFKFSPNSNTFIDLGLGTTYSKADVKLYLTVDRRNQNFQNTHFWNFIPSAGIRKHTKRNFMYRFSLSTVVTQYGLLPYIGFSFGKRF